LRVVSVFASDTQIPVTLLCEMDTLQADVCSVYHLLHYFFPVAFSIEHQESDGSRLTLIAQLMQSVIQNKPLNSLTLLLL